MIYTDERELHSCPRSGPDTAHPRLTTEPLKLCASCNGYRSSSLGRRLPNCTQPSARSTARGERVSERALRGREAGEGGEERERDAQPSTASPTTIVTHAPMKPDPTLVKWPSAMSLYLAARSSYDWARAISEHAATDSSLPQSVHHTVLFGTTCGCERARKERRSERGRAGEEREGERRTHLEVALERLEVHVDALGAEQRIVRQRVARVAPVAESEAHVEPARARAAVAQLEHGGRRVVDHGRRVLDTGCGGDVGHVCEIRQSQCCSRKRQRRKARRTEDRQEGLVAAGRRARSVSCARARRREDRKTHAKW